MGQDESNRMAHLEMARVSVMNTSAREFHLNLCLNKVILLFTFQIFHPPSPLPVLTSCTGTLKRFHNFFASSKLLTLLGAVRETMLPSDCFHASDDHIDFPRCCKKSFSVCLKVQRCCKINDYLSRHTISQGNNSFSLHLN